MNWDVNANKFIETARAEFLERHGGSFDHKLRAWVESPIEQMVLAALLADGWEYPEQAFWGRCVDTMKVLGARSSAILHRLDCEYVIAAQATIAVPFKYETSRAYRADFIAFDAWQEKPAKLVVELDGHDFHERTKVQAQRDKSRDRTLAKLGWTVIRFTGSEVFARPPKVLEEIHQHFYQDDDTEAGE